MKKLYQIIRYDKHNNKEVLSGGITAEVAEEALKWSNTSYTSIQWSNSPIHRQDANVEIYEGMVIE